MLKKKTDRFINKTISDSDEISLFLVFRYTTYYIIRTIYLSFVFWLLSLACVYYVCIYWFWNDNKEDHKNCPRQNVFNTSGNRSEQQTENGTFISYYIMLFIIILYNIHHHKSSAPSPCSVPGVVV